MTRRWIVPTPSDDWALFLDVDGTLLEIAATPDAVQVGADLPPLLAEVSGRFNNALALISGRCIRDLDTLFNPYRFPAAGIHGVERRDTSGVIHSTGLTPEDLEPARSELRRFTERHSGLLLEDKGRSLALHYRLAPWLESEAREIVNQAIAKLRVPAHVQPGHCVIEIKSGCATKRTAIEQFMQEPPFNGRVPVFVGDDLTDRDGFVYVESVGGHAVYVAPDPEPGRGWLPHPAAVREWLKSLLA